MHGVEARESDAGDSVAIGPANMYRLASTSLGPLLMLTEASFTGAVLFMAGHRDPGALAGHHAMLHETLHTCGPQIEGASAVAVEELITELAAREVLRLTLSTAYDEAPLRAGAASLSCCYQDLIEIAATAFGGERGAAITALAAGALEIKRSKSGTRGSYQAIAVLLAVAGSNDVTNASDRIVDAFQDHWTQTRNVQAGGRTGTSPAPV